MKKNLIMASNTQAQLKQGQRGAVLIVSLIILLVLTVVVLSANQDVVIQERSTAAIRESNLVFQAAETALRDAEEHIEGLGSDLFNDSGFISPEDHDGLYNRGGAPVDYLNNSSWAGTSTIVAPSVSGNYSARFFIEDIEAVPLDDVDLDLGLNTSTNQVEFTPTARVFRIVVRAQGRDGVPRRFLSGYYSTEI